MSILPFRLYGLLDCNSFFASCEKLFRPDLANKPVVVLSNNDGVVVARSLEAKKIGIPMGAAFFKIKHLLNAGKVHVFSSNFRLYGDISNRIMRLLQRWTPDIEVYSIDEAFMDLTGLGLNSERRIDFMYDITEQIKKWTGIPVSIGLGTTMTLAKVANDAAKKFGSCCDITDNEVREEILAKLPVGDVWGVGRKLKPKFERHSINTAADLAAVDPLWVRKNFSIVQEQLVRELNGEHCLDIHTAPAARKSIQVSRSFHDAVEDFQTLSESVASFAAKACEEARQDGTVASGVYVHVNTSRFRDSYYSAGSAIGFDCPTSHTPTVIHKALELLRQLFQPNQLYKRASVILLELRDAESVLSQGILFDTDTTRESKQRSRKLMQAVDNINSTFGKRSVVFGSQGIDREANAVSAKHYCSPSYTSSWDSLPVAKAK
ncbi:MAG: Y-family DNA polymerase [Planctomycetaceae bacterium]|nr:Y-family DNA polymerase [Planctomycetaceae bacterium]